MEKKPYSTSLKRSVSIMMCFFGAAWGLQSQEVAVRLLHRRCCHGGR
jgi:hypothetical protein